MYYGHLNHNKYSYLSKRRDREEEHRHLSGVESVLPTIIAVGIVVVFLLSGVVSYALTKEVSADGTHTHWTWFGKYMINEDGRFSSHHFAHPDKCAICKQITKEMNERKNKN
jgi:N-glycosylase/DNA lyase